MADQPTARPEPGAPARVSRRAALERLATFAVATPVLARGLGERWTWSAADRGLPIPGASAAGDVQEYLPDLMAVVNLHEFEDLARRRLSIRTFDYVAAGSADDLTMTENAAAFERFWIRRRVMQDASGVDTSIELFGRRLEHPILLGPVGLRQLLREDGHRLTALGAHATGAVLVGAGIPLMEELARSDRMPTWWASSLGSSDRADAAEWARRQEGAGASALCVSVDYPYTASRDRPARHGWQRGWNDGNYSTGDAPVVFQPGAIDPYYPDLTWSWMEWVKSASSLPVVIKGIVTGADARLAVEHGADALVVSNHGGRTLDGTRGTLDALPEVVAAVGGRIPVLVDGGVRRGGDIVKALGLGATATLIGRPYLWGLGVYGQPGVERVIELLKGELSIALGLSGAVRAADVPGGLVQRAWQPWTS